MTDLREVAERPKKAELMAALRKCVTLMKQAVVPPSPGNPTLMEYLDAIAEGTRLLARMERGAGEEGRDDGD